MVDLAKRGARLRWGRKLTEAFVRNGKSFWRDKEKARSGTKIMVQVVKGEDGQVIVEDVEVSEREI